MVPIGIFDSGLGGLTVLRALEKALPDQAFLYYADTRNAPYGPRPENEIRFLVGRAVDAMFDAGCRLIILACNTACAVALRPMQVAGVPSGRRVLGVLVPLVEAVTGRNWEDDTPPGRTDISSIAIFATVATVKSGMFETELSKRMTGVEIAAQACHGLVEAIERGENAEEIAGKAVEDLLRRCTQPDIALLACTHYPLVEDAFRAALPGNTRILSQADVTAERLSLYLDRHPEFKSKGLVRFLTTGDPAEVLARAERFLGLSLPFESAA